MENKNEPEIVLITNEDEVQTEFPDREGGATHGRILQKIFGKEKRIDIGKMKENFDSCLDQVSQLLDRVKEKAVEGWQLEDVKIALAVSAEGSIGVATAGVEASIEVTFKPRV